MIGLIIVGSIYFILLDELIMGCAQRRIGPFNLGGYGFLSSLINGCNLIISQFLVPKQHFHFGYQSFPIFFFLFTLQNYILLYPFFLVDIYLSLIILI
jgi:NADH:ubiquinone oxidoreductase subunit H